MHNILTSSQKILLNTLAESDFIRNNFYLSGGTALAEFYLGHRLSEDLDFFSEKEVDIQEVTNFLSSIKEDLGIKSLDLQQSYNRNLIFIHYEDQTIKTEFTYYPFQHLKEPKKYNNLDVDSLYDILVNKIFTISQKPRSRDFIDVFYINKVNKVEIKPLIIDTQTKFDWHIDPIQLITKFQEVHSLSDLPNMILDFNQNEVEKYFDNLSLKLSSDIFT